MDEATRRLLNTLGHFKVDTSAGKTQDPPKFRLQELQAILDHDNHGAREQMKAFVGQDQCYIP